MPDEGESYWTDLDRGYALAWTAEQGEAHTCGQPLSESTAKSNQFKYGAEAVRCHACAALDREAERFKKQDGADTAGLMVRLTTTPHGAVER